MLDVYETIATFGLTENGADLPIPDDDALRDKIVRETFEGLFAGLKGTGLQYEIEPLAHGLASLLDRRKQAMATELERASDVIRGLIRAEDGSEVITMQIEEGQRQADRALDLLDGLEVMAEAAARCYEIETGRAFLPASSRRGGRTGRSGRTAHLTGAVFEAKAWLEAHERQEAERFRVEGRPLAVAGARDWMDHARVWEVLDRSAARYRDRYASGLILYHKGDRKGVDAIAAAWARSRQVPQVVFRPNWSAFGKRAGFRAIDEMFETPKPLGGVTIFGETGIALNLADKAETRGVPVLRVRAT